MNPLRMLAGAGALALGSAAVADRVDLAVFENADDADVSGLDLWVGVVADGESIDFTFHNDSSIGSVVTSVYFESTGFSLDCLDDGEVSFESAGVDFSDGATPPSPPGSIAGYGGSWGGNLYAADADSPSPAKGVGVGELLTISFEMDDECSLEEVLGALQSDPAAFRIAQHVQGLPNGSSVWLVNTPTLVPLPATAWMGGVGLLLPLGLAVARRR